jgi:ribosome-associated protein
MGLIIKNGISIADHELEFQAIRAQGSGGQNVNKVSSAIHLRFDITTSSLPEVWKERLRAYSDQRITDDGVIIIKAQQFRTQEKNRDDALERLKQLILAAVAVQKPRRATKPTRASQVRRQDSKTLRGRVKATRGRVRDE